MSRSFPEKRQPCRCSPWESTKKGEEAGASETPFPTQRLETDYRAPSLQESWETERPNHGCGVRRLEI